MGIGFLKKKKGQIVSHHYHNEAKLILDAKIKHPNIQVSSTEEYVYPARDFITITKIELVNYPEDGERIVVFQGAKGKAPEVYRPQGSERWEEYWSTVFVPRAKQKLREQKQKTREKKRADNQTQKNDKKTIWDKNHSPLP